MRLRDVNVPEVRQLEKLGLTIFAAATNMQYLL